MMKLSVLFLFALLCGTSLAISSVFTIDDFIVDSPAIVIIIQNTGALPISSSNFVTDDTILGGERDLELVALTGGTNLVLSAGVSAGSFNSAAPKGANGESFLQYDGADGTIDLNPSGLFNYYYNDFGLDGAFALRTNITADIATNVFFRVYSGSATDFCEYKQRIPGNSQATLYTLKYVDFNETGSGCDFNNVGAFEVEVDLSQNVDISIDVIELIANNPTPSRTPSRTPSKRPASPSRTRTPTPSRAAASESRTRTPTPSRAAASASRTRTPSPSRVAASASRTRTPTPSRAPASESRTRTPTPSRVPASASRTRTPTPSRAPASQSRTRTPSPSRIPASPSRTRTPSSIPRSPSNTPSPTSCICTCPELECFMFQYGEFTFNGRAGRNIIDEFAELDQVAPEEEGFDFLQLF